MSWQTDNYIKRIFNAFKRSKDKIYTEDIEALKQLNNELIVMQKTYVNDNILFLKLLSIHLKTELDYFKDISFAKKNIHSQLSLPIDYHVNILKKSLEHIDFENYGKSLGLSFEFLDNKETEIKDKGILTNNQKEIIEKLKKEWTYDKVEKALYNTANEFLKDTENYV